MHKIDTCEYFTIWSKYIHVSKSIFTLRSHANRVHMVFFINYTELLQPKYILTLFLHWYCTRRWFNDKLGIFHANQTSMCLDPHLNLG